MVRFNLFGFPVTIEPFFWLLCAVIAFAGMPPSGGPEVLALGLTKAVVLFTAILLHELGHALAYKRFGSPHAAITIHGMGGLCTGSGHFTPKQKISISFAGPLVNIILAGVGFAAMKLLPAESSSLPYVAASTLFIFNAFVAALNLLPILPMDGGRIAEQLLGPRRIRTVAIIGIVTAVLAAAFSWLSFSFLILPFLFLYFAYQNFQILQRSGRGRF